MKRLTKVTSTVLAVVTLSAIAGRSYAQTVPYKSAGTGIYSPISGDYSGSGVGTHLGHQTFFGNVAIVSNPSPLVYGFQSTVPQVTIAANGDKIFFSSYGEVQLIPLDNTFTMFSAVWSGKFVVEGGTGRFANVGPAAEPLDVIAINDPFALTDPEWSFSWTLTGKISLH